MTITDNKTGDDEQQSMCAYFVIFKPRNCEEMISSSQVLKLQNTPPPQILVKNKISPKKGHFSHSKTLKWPFDSKDF